MSLAWSYSTIMATPSALAQIWLTTNLCAVIGCKASTPFLGGDGTNM